ncbi:hypothetical protein B0H14DRAFT_3169094 [Mycena olivaceomarginata]|nr:hypothetical protein B0H14DRAFT_3169094 [Mycena olivaceomarginata]
MSTKNNSRISGAVPQVKSCMHAVSLGLVASTLFPLLENVLKPSTYSLDIPLDTPCYQWNCNDARELTSGRGKMGPLSKCFSHAITRSHLDSSVLETQANRIAHKLGLGPHAVAGKITSHFGDREHRVQQLEFLHTTVPPKLKKWCSKLVKYSLPIKRSRKIVDLVTLFPCLRVLFIKNKVLDNTTSLDAMSELWNRPTGPPDQEWMFWQNLAATCLSDTMISAILERRSVSDSTTCSEEGLSVIESLLVGQNFWVPIEASEAPFDYDGVDFLATTLLNSLSNWFGKLDQKDWAMQPWYHSFTQVLQLLRDTFEDVLPTIYQDRVLNVMVDNQNIIPGDQATPAANHSTDNLSAHSINSDHDANQESSEQGIESLDDSQSQTSNLDSGGLPLHNEESTGSEDLDFSEEDGTVSDITGYEEQFGMALGHDLDCTWRFGIPRISGAQTLLESTAYPSLEAQCKDLEEQKLILLNKRRDLGDSHPETLDAMQNLAWLHHELGEFSSARDLRVAVLETYHILWGKITQQWRSIAKFWEKIIQRLCGPCRLWQIAHRWLGQLTEAEDQYHIILQKKISILGENHPHTLQAMEGQLKKAENLLTAVFDKQKKVLGDEHLNTLHTMCTLTSTYRQLGLFSAAEELATVSLKKLQKVYGEQHPDAQWMVGELASIFQAQDNLCQSMGKIQAAEGLERLV